MKNVVIAGTLVLIISLSQAYGALDSQKQPMTCLQTPNSQQENTFDHILLARSGCCSWHQGACGCSGSRQLCCDGTLSPTCMCGELGDNALIKDLRRAICIRL